MNKNSGHVGSAAAYHEIGAPVARETVIESVTWLLTQLGSWLLLGSVIGVAFIMRANLDWLWVWVVLYAAFSGGLNVWRRFSPFTYDIQASKIARIGLNLVLITGLIGITGGPTSPFWYGYLLPLSAAIIYARQVAQPLLVWGLITSAYLAVAARGASGSATSAPPYLEMGGWVWPVAVLVNTMVLLLVAILGHHLTTLARRNRNLLVEGVEAFRRAIEELEQIENEQMILDLAVQRARTLVGASGGSFARASNRPGPVEVEAIVPPGPLDRVRRSFGPGEGAAGQAAKLRQPILIRNAHTDVRFVAAQSPASIGSVIAVPVIGQGSLFGVLSVDSPSVDKFAEWQAHLLGSYALAVGDQLERARLQQALQALRESISGNLESVLATALDWVERLTPFDSATIFLEDGPDLRAALTRRQPHAELAATVRIRIDEDRLYRDLKALQRPIILADAQRDSRFQKLGQSDHVHGWLGVPLIAGTDVLGMIAIDSVQVQAYSRADARLASIVANYAALSIRDVTAQDALRKKNSQLRALQDASIIISSQFTKTRIAEEVLKIVKEMFKVEGCSLLEYDRDRQSLRFLRITLGQTVQPFDKFSIPLGLGLAGAAARLQTTVIANAVEQDPRWDQRFDRLTGFRTHSLLAEPLILQNELVGVIELINKTPAEGLFDEEDQRLLKSIAASTAVAIRNADLIYRAERIGQTIKALHQSAHQVASSLAGEDLMCQIIEEGVQLVQASGGAIYLNEAGAAEVVVRAQIGLKDVLVGRTLPIGESAFAEAMQKRAPVIRNDYANDPKRLALLDEFGLSAAVAAPLQWHGEIIGAIAVHDTKPDRKFSEDEGQLLMTFADFAALMVMYAQTGLVQRFAIERSTEAIVVINRKGRILEFNPKAESSLGYSKAEVLGWGERGVVRLYGGNVDRARAVDHLLREQGRLDEQPETLIRKDGRHVSVLRTAVYDPDTGISIAFFRDDWEIAARGRLIAQVTELIQTMQEDQGQAHPLEALSHFVNTTRGFLSAASVILYLYDEDTQNLRVPPIAAGVTNPLALSGPIRAGSLPYIILHSAEPMFINDLTDRPDLLNSRFAQSEGTAALFGSCLKLAERPLAVLICNFQTPRFFDTDKRELFQNFSQATAVAVNNMLRFRQIRRETLRLKDASQVRLVAMPDTQHDVALKAILKDAAEYCSTTTYGLVADGTELQSWWTEQQLGPDEFHLDPQPHSDSCAIGRARITRQLTIVPNTTDEPAWPDTACSCRRYGSIATLPIMVGSSKVGVAWLAHASPFHLTEYDRSFLNEVNERLLLRSNLAAMDTLLAKAHQLYGLARQTKQVSGLGYDHDFLNKVSEVASQATGCLVRIGVWREGRMEYSGAEFDEGHWVSLTGVSTPTLSEWIEQVLKKRTVICRPIGQAVAGIWPFDVMGDVIGLLEVYGPRPDSLSEREQVFLGSVANFLALALHFSMVSKAQYAVSQLDFFNSIGLFLIHYLQEAAKTIDAPFDDLIKQVPSVDDELQLRVQKAKEKIAHLRHLSDEINTMRELTSMPTYLVDLRQCLTEALKPIDLPTTISLETDGLEHLPPASGNTQTLTEVFRSLISNAIKALRDVDRQQLRLEGCETKDGQWVGVTISDTGCGIPPDRMSDVFMPFRYWPTELQPGWGIGLWMCKLAVEAWGGELTIESQPALEVGTRVTVWLRTKPVVVNQPHSRIAESGRRKAAQPRPPRRTILLASPERVIRSVIADRLKQLNYQTYEAGSYSQAAEIVALYSLDSAIVDVNLLSNSTEVQGLGLAHLVHHYHPKADILAVAADEHDTDLDSWRQMGLGQPVIVLPKDHDWDGFLARIARALGRSITPLSGDTHE